MSESSNSTVCEFCAKLENQSPGREWFDRILYRDENFAVFPAFGSLVPGYVLIIPTRHVTSICALESGFFESFLRTSEQIAHLIGDRFGSPVTIFEHGCAEDRQEPSGACIDHAHWHMLPLPNGISIDGDDWWPAQDFESAKHLLKSHNYQYLFSRGRHRVHIGSVPSQFIRRVVAAEVGHPDEWDYAAFPFFDNLRTTFDRLKDMQLSPVRR